MTNNHKSRVSSSFSSNASDEEEIFQSGPGQQVQKTIQFAVDRYCRQQLGMIRYCQLWLEIIRHSTMISRSPKFLIIAPQKRPCPKLEGAGDNDSANIEMLLSTEAMHFATMFTVPVFRHTYSV